MTSVANIRSMLDTMLAMQDSMNTKVHPEWRTQGFAWQRAIYMECGEAVDSIGWKWWKKRGEVNWYQIQLEFIDIWHFMLSDLGESSDCDKMTSYYADTLYDNAHEVQRQSTPVITPEAVIKAFEVVATFSLGQLTFPGYDVYYIYRADMFPEAIVPLMNALDLTIEKVYEMYVNKNVLNHFRQDHGYNGQNGMTYAKLWFGKEDNVHLEEIAPEVFANVTAEEYPKALYASLEARYAEYNQSMSDMKDALLNGRDFLNELNLNK